MFNILRSVPEQDKIGKVEFYGWDSLENFENNRIKQSIYWTYHTKEIQYTLNSHGYRAAEFNSIDWANSILVFGCSFIFGVGVDDIDTLPSRLNSLVDYPVVNMGIAGGSAMHMWALTTQLVDHNITPKACVYIWPGLSRVACFEANNLHRCWGPWTTPDTGNLGPWNYEHHGNAYFNLTKASVMQQWPNVQQQHWTWNDYTYKIGGKFTGPLLTCYDKGRDLTHPGPVSLDNWAHLIYEKL